MFARKLLRDSSESNLWDLDVFSSSDLGVWLSLHPQSTRQSVVTIATGVSGATDASGNSRTFTQGTGANQSAYQATEFNGFPCLSFDGVDDFMNFSCPQNYNQVVMAVVDTANLNTNYRLFLNRTDSIAPALYFGSGYPAAVYCPLIYWGNEKSVQITPIQRKAIFFWNLGGAASGFNQTNIDAKSLVSQANTETTLSNWISLNSNVDVQSSNIKVAELAILENPSQDTIDRVYGIFAHRWWRLAGLPVPLDASHLYYSSPPLR